MSEPKPLDYIYLTDGGCGDFFCGAGSIETKSVKLTVQNKYSLTPQEGCGCEKLSPEAACELSKWGFAKYSLSSEIVIHKDPQPRGPYPNYDYTVEPPELLDPPTKYTTSCYHTVDTYPNISGGCEDPLNVTYKYLPDEQPEYEDCGCRDDGYGCAPYGSQCRNQKLVRRYVTSDPEVFYFPYFYREADDSIVLITKGCFAAQETWPFAFNCDFIHDRKTDPPEKIGLTTGIGSSVVACTFKLPYVFCDYEYVGFIDPPYDWPYDEFGKIRYQTFYQTYFDGKDLTDKSTFEDIFVDPHKKASLPNEWRNSLDCGRNPFINNKVDLICINSADFYRQKVYCTSCDYVGEPDPLYEDSIPIQTTNPLGYERLGFEIDYSKLAVRWRFAGIYYMRLWILEWTSRHTYGYHFANYNVSVVRSNISEVILDTREFVESIEQSTRPNLDVCLGSAYCPPTMSDYPSWKDNFTPTYILDPLDIGTEYGKGEPPECSDQAPEQSAGTTQLSGVAIIGISTDYPTEKNGGITYTPPLYRLDNGAYECRVHQYEYKRRFGSDALDRNPIEYWCPYILPSNFPQYSSYSDKFDISNKLYFDSFLNINTCGAP